MIQTQNFSNFPEFANNGTKTAPGESKYAQGFVPSDVLPAEWANYFFNGSTKGITALNEGVKSVEAEINNVLSAKNITPNPAVNNQLLQAIRDLTVPVGIIYTQYPLEKAPWEVWKFTQQSNWQDISSHYAGLFSRVAGGNAETFNKQLNCTAANTTVTFNTSGHGITDSSLLIDTNSWEQRAVTAVSGRNVTIESPFSNGSGVTTVLVIQNETLPNILIIPKNTFRVLSVSGEVSENGAFTQYQDAYRTNGFAPAGQGFSYSLGFDAHRGNTTYKNDAEVQSKNFTIRIWKRIN